MRRFCLVLLATALPAFASTWTELGPKYPGRVSAIAASDAAHVWVATPGGGVWKSSDGGATFTWAGNYALGDFSVQVFLTAALHGIEEVLHVVLGFSPAVAELARFSGLSLVAVVDLEALVIEG